MHNKDSPMLLTLVVVVAGFFALALSNMYNTNVGSAIAPVTYNSVDQTNNYIFCYDGDGGQNFYLKGIVTYGDQSSNSSVTDYCRNYNSSTLVEYYCDGLTLNSADIVCPYGCSDGVCLLPQSETCQDSDYGYNVYIKGTATYTDGSQTISQTDICLDNKTLTEYTCSGTKIASNITTCENGCNNGVCERTV